MTDLWYNMRVFGRLRRGQAMMEYILSFAMLLVVVSILWGMVSVTKRYSERTENLVASDCP